MTVWIYVDTRKQIGDKDHLRVFATAEAAEAWFEKNDRSNSCCDGLALS
jgi:hypothetical protein